MVGSQDQVIAAYGGFNIIKFEPDGSKHLSPIITNPESGFNFGFFLSLEMICILE